MVSFGQFLHSFLLICNFFCKRVTVHKQLEYIIFWCNNSQFSPPTKPKWYSLQRETLPPPPATASLRLTASESTTAHTSVLDCRLVQCSAVHCTAVRCSIMKSHQQHTHLCTGLHGITVYCSALQCSPVQYSDCTRISRGLYWHCPVISACISNVPAEEKLVF